MRFCRTTFLFRLACPCIVLAALSSLSVRLALAQDGVEETKAVTAVSGVVVGEGEKPVADCAVYLLMTFYDPDRGRQTDSISAKTRTDAAGKFAFNRVTQTTKYGRLGLLAVGKEGRLALSPVTPELPDDLRLSLASPGNVSGKVLDSAGKPLSGVSVTAIAFQSPYGDGGDINRFFQSLPEEIQPLFQTKTDEAGKYSFAILPHNGQASLKFSHRGFNQAHAFISASDPKPQQITLRRQTRITGVLKSSDPAFSPKGFLLFANWGEMGGSFAPVEEDGSFAMDNVPPGKVKLTLQVPTSSEWQPEVRREVTVQEGQTLSGVTISVNAIKGVLVTGRILDDATGKGIPDYWFNITNQSGANTDKEGNYRFYAPPGPVSITIHSFDRRDGYLLPEQPIVKSGKGEAGQTLTLEDIRLKKGKSLSVRVVDTAGKPVARAALLNTERPWESALGVTDRRGEVTLQGLAEQGKLTLTAQNREGFSLPVVLDLQNAAAPVTLTVRPDLAVFLSGTVLDDAGQPVVGAAVQISETYESSTRFSQNLTTDKAGKWRTTTPLPPGATYSAKVQAKSHRIASSEKWKAEQGGKHDFGTLHLPRLLGKISGVVVDATGKPVAGARVFNSGDSDMPVSATTDASGTFLLEGLDQGLCFLCAEKPGQPLGVLRVNAPTNKARLVLRPLKLNRQPTKELLAARQQFALQIIQQAVAEAEKKPGDEWAAQRAVDLLVPLNPAQAVALANRFGQPTKNSLNNSLGRQALKLRRSVPEALTYLGKVDHPYWRTRNLIDLSREATVEQARLILPVALESARTVMEEVERLQLLADIGDRMLEVQMPEGAGLLKECGEKAAKLAPTEGNGWQVAYLAERFSEVDLEGALKLVLALPRSEYYRNNTLERIAVRHCLRSPQKAVELLETHLESWGVQNALPRLCAHLANRMPDQAEKLLEKIPKGRLRIQALLLMTERISDPGRALKTLARADGEMREWAATLQNQNVTDELPALYFLWAAMIGQRLSYPGAGDLVGLAIAFRPPLMARFEEDMTPFISHANMAQFLPLVDPTLGKAFAETVLPRLSDLKYPAKEYMQYTKRQIQLSLLNAAAMTDPVRAAAYLAYLKEQEDPKAKDKLDSMAVAEWLLDENRRKSALYPALMINNPDL